MVKLVRNGLISLSERILQKYKKPTYISIVLSLMKSQWAGFSTTKTDHSYSTYAKFSEKQ